MWFSRLLTARQIYAPAKSAFPPSLAVEAVIKATGMYSRRILRATWIQPEYIHSHFLILHSPGFKT